MSPFLQEETRLKHKLDLISNLGLILATSGAETRLVLSSMDLLAKALEIKIQSSLNRTGVFVTCEGRFGQILSFRKIKNFGINMATVTSCHRLCLKAENGEFESVKAIEDELKKIGQKTYPKALIVPMEALAGGAIAILNGGSFKVYMASVFGALILMALRFFLTKKGYFEAFCFMASAFVGGLASLLALRLFHASYQEEILAIIATSLILVPGFPLLNGFLDIFKGYIETGLMRSFQALILIISAAFGILGVICVTNFYNL